MVTRFIQLLLATSHYAFVVQGVHGWRLQPEVKVYSSYEIGDVPPDPEIVELDSVESAAARDELVKLGIMST